MFSYESYNTINYNDMYDNTLTEGIWKACVEIQ